MQHDKNRLGAVWYVDPRGLGPSFAHHSTLITTRGLKVWLSMAARKHRAQLDVPRKRRGLEHRKGPRYLIAYVTPKRGCAGRVHHVIAQPSPFLPTTHTLTAQPLVIGQSKDDMLPKFDLLGFVLGRQQDGFGQAKPRCILSRDNVDSSSVSSPTMTACNLARGNLNCQQRNESLPWHPHGSMLSCPMTPQISACPVKRAN
ncbi:hypothetical protein QBC34DRAFT_134449 [Podospora aff. communis PSN243]|uniref:Uncharacterized protein n=1 Tax=Podospora aff. communis PSN243 TaxID=3040156 RepID=A0AAV9H0C0_9PEZI|nr:hypothetical protein QBC34DRAFT_134449 [Podospora aff. communis PSN243]